MLVRSDDDPKSNPAASRGYPLDGASDPNLGHGQFRLLLAVSSADVGFIDLDFTATNVVLDDERHGTAKFAETAKRCSVAAEPLELLEAQGAALLVDGHQEHGLKPSPNWLGRVVEDRARSQGGFLAALSIPADVHLPSWSASATVASVRANEPVRPTGGAKVVGAGLLG